MSNILVPCDHVECDSESTTQIYDNVIPINTYPPNQNLKLNLDNITHKILTELKPLAQDLLKIGSYIYYADLSVQRGTEAEVYADSWCRNFDFVIPVNSPHIWNTPEIKDLLQETFRVSDWG